MLWAGITQSVLRRAKAWESWVRFPAGAREFSLFHCFQTESGAHPPFNADVKKDGPISPLPHTSSWRNI
jgi:hypothetical protein